jgi:hypothetical protein
VCGGCALGSCCDRVFGESGLGLSLTVEGGKMEVPDECPAGGKVWLVGCAAAAVDVPEPPCVPAGRGRLERYAAIGGYVLGWRAA